MVVVFLIKSTWPPVLSGHNFLVPDPGPPLVRLLPVWYYPDISHSLLKSEFEESLGQEEESDESSSDVEPLLKLEAVVREVPDVEDTSREEGASSGSLRRLPSPEASFTHAGHNQAPSGTSDKGGGGSKISGATHSGGTGAIAQHNVVAFLHVTTQTVHTKNVLFPIILSQNTLLFHTGNFRL